MTERKEFKLRRDLTNLLGGRADVLSADGWIGCPYWMSRVDGAALPPLPPRLMTATEPSDGLAKEIRKYKRAYAFSAACDLGEPVERPNLAGHYARAISGWHGCWPLIADAGFTTNMERSWPDADWRVTANGALLRIAYVANRPTLRAVVMAICPPASELAHVQGANQ